MQPAACANHVVKGQIVVYVGLFRDLQKAFAIYSGDGEGGWPWGVHWCRGIAAFGSRCLGSNRLFPRKEHA